MCCLTANSRPICTFQSMEADLTSSEKFPGDTSSVWLPENSLPPDATKYTHIYCLKLSRWSPMCCFVCLGFVVEDRTVFLRMDTRYKLMEKYLLSWSEMLSPNSPDESVFNTLDSMCLWPDPSLPLESWQLAGLFFSKRKLSCKLSFKLTFYFWQWNYWESDFFLDSIISSLSLEAVMSGQTTAGKSRSATLSQILAWDSQCDLLLPWLTSVLSPRCPLILFRCDSSL